MKRSREAAAAAGGFCRNISGLFSRYFLFDAISEGRLNSAITCYCIPEELRSIIYRTIKRHTQTSFCDRNFITVSVQKNIDN